MLIQQYRRCTDQDHDHKVDGNRQLPMLQMVEAAYGLKDHYRVHHMNGRTYIRRRINAAQIADHIIQNSGLMRILRQTQIQPGRDT